MEGEEKPIVHQFQNMFILMSVEMNLVDQFLTLGKELTPEGL